MKHALLLLIVVLVVYGGYHLCNPIERRAALRSITRHGLRIATFILAALALLAIAYHLPSTTIL